MRLETLLPDLKLALERTGDGIWGDALESLLARARRALRAELSPVAADLLGEWS